MPDGWRSKENQTDRYASKNRGGDVLPEPPIVVFFLPRSHGFARGYLCQFAAAASVTTFPADEPAEYASRRCASSASWPGNRCR